MSGVLIGTKPRHPENKSLSEALKEDADAIKARKGLIDKTATMVKVSDDGAEAGSGTGASMRPTDEQLNKINGFTKKTVTADEVVCFNTLSCNDIVDRDDDQFTTQCVKDFAELPQPYSPTGKSFMLNHSRDVTQAAGRIFETDTTKEEGALFLQNGVYVPNTPQFQPLIERIDFGISWAVSVGVMLGKDACGLEWCKAPFSSWGWWCSNGHDKGMFYTKDAEEDAYGYPLPCDSRTSGAQKCVRQFSEPKDMYELSQVFLGAQYFAQLERDPGFAAVMKSVASEELPYVGVSKQEALKLPVPHEPERLAQARKDGLVKETDDGALVWTDREGLVWTFDPEAPSDGVQSLGKANDDNNSEEENDGEHEVPGGPGSDEDDAVAGEDPSLANAGAGDGGSGEGGDHAAAELELASGEPGDGESGSAVADEDTDDEDSEDEEKDSEDDDSDDSDEEEDDDSEEEKSVSKKAVLSAASKSKLPDSVIDAAKGASGNGLEALLLAASSEIQQLQPKAALGDQYVKELRAEAINAYVRNHATKTSPKVSVDTFEKVLDKCGDDTDLLKSLRDEQMDEARKKYPDAVRRSSFPTDPNTVVGIKTADDIEEVSEGGSDNAKRVKRIHG